MVSAKQRAVRSRFAAIMKSGGFGRKRNLNKKKLEQYGSARIGGKWVSHSSGGLRTMARRSRGRRRSKGFLGGGIMSIVGPAVAGYLGSSVSPSIPVVNTLPYSNVIAGGLAGYLVGKKKGALIGAATALVVPSVLGTVSSATSGDW